MRLCNFNPLQVVPGEPVENLLHKVHLMNLHAGGSLETGIRLHGAML